MRAEDEPLGVATAAGRGEEGDPVVEVAPDSQPAPVEMLEAAGGVERKARQT